MVTDESTSAKEGSNRRLEKNCIMHVLYPSPSIIRVRKSKRTRYALLACIGKNRD